MVSRKHHRTNQWTKEQNLRRYVLHQRIKTGFQYSAKGRTVWVTPEKLADCSPAESRAVDELKTVFEYNLQFEIQTLTEGNTVEINPAFIEDKQKGKIYRVERINGIEATIKPVKGRWKKDKIINTKLLIPK